MREKELEYLRNELNQRLCFAYEHSRKLFGHIMLVWGGTLVLFNARQGDFVGSGLMLFIMATIFFISVVVLYFLAQRNSENINQIFKIAAYIIVFYEKRPIGGEYERIFWELANFEIHKKEIHKPKEFYNFNKFENEYFWLSVIATAIIVAIIIGMNNTLSIIGMNDLFSIIGFKPIYICLKNKNTFDVWMFFGCLCYIVISAILSYKIFKYRLFDPEKWYDTKKVHLKYFLDYAIEDTGHYTEADAKELFGEGVYNEIRNGSS